MYFQYIRMHQTHARTERTNGESIELLMRKPLISYLSKSFIQFIVKLYSSKLLGSCHLSTLFGPESMNFIRNIGILFASTELDFFILQICAVLRNAYYILTIELITISQLCYRKLYIIYNFLYVLERRYIYIRLLFLIIGEMPLTYSHQQQMR